MPIQFEDNSDIVHELIVLRKKAVREWLETKSDETQDLIDSYNQQLRELGVIR